MDKAPVLSTEAGLTAYMSTDITAIVKIIFKMYKIRKLKTLE